MLRQRLKRVLGVGAFLSALLSGAPGQTPGSESEMTEAAFDAVARGLDYLARRQQSDGSWSSDVGFKLNEDYKVTASNEPHVGVTSLACMSFLAGGYLPGRGPYGEVIGNGLEYVLAQVKDDGYITAHGTRMYSHAFATLFLAEIFGMTHRPDVHDKLQRAVDLIVASQNEKGSWRYLPFAKDSDMSITVCQVMALRAARNIGIKVPQATIDRAVTYVLNSAVREDSYSSIGFGRNEKGSFKYQDKEGARSSFPLTAAGITTLYGAGIYSSDDIEAGLEYLKRYYDEVTRMYRFHYFYYYGHYYAVQAFYIAGGRYWEWYWPRIRDELVSGQSPDGSWPNQYGPGRSFATAVATLILQIPFGYLPIFQR